MDDTATATLDPQERLVRVAAGIDGVPTITQIDEMLECLRAMPQTADRSATVHELFELRCQIEESAAA